MRDGGSWVVVEGVVILLSEDSLGLADLASRKAEKERRFCFFCSAVVEVSLDDELPSSELSLNLTILADLV